MNLECIYPRTDDLDTVYLKNVINNPNICIGDFTIYNDFVNDRDSLRKTMCCTTIRSTTINL